MINRVLAIILFYALVVSALAYVVFFAECSMTDPVCNHRVTSVLVGAI